MVTKYSCTGLDMRPVYGAAVSGLTMVSLQFYKTFSEVFRRKTGSRCWKPVNSSHFYNLLEVASKADSRNKYLSMYLFVCMKIKYMYKDNFVFSISGIR